MSEYKYTNDFKKLVRLVLSQITSDHCFCISYRTSFVYLHNPLVGYWICTNEDVIVQLEGYTAFAYGKIYNTYVL